MKVQVLLSTCNKNKIEDLDLHAKNIKENCLIINQTDKKYSLVRDKNIEVYSYNERGLSKSRNRLLDLATGDIGIITDDDIKFFDNYDLLLEEAYLKYPYADVITFCTKKGNVILGGNNFFNHNLYTAMKVLSFQISFKISSIKKSNVKFNELFGLGSIYEAGEENIFLYDCMRKGLKIIHVPIIINEHPDEKTTGEKWNEELVMVKGAFSYHILKQFHYLFFLYFLIFKFKYYKENMSVISFINSYKLGIVNYKNRNCC